MFHSPICVPGIVVVGLMLDLISDLITDTTGARMATRDNTYGPIQEETRDLLRKQLAAGWTAARISYEMERRGHKWTVPVVTGAVKHQRMFTADETIAVLAIFKGNALRVVREVDRIIAQITAEGEAK